MVRPGRIDFPGVVGQVAGRGDGKAIGPSCGIGSAAVAALDRRVAARPEVLEAIELLTRQLARSRLKLSV